MLRNQILSYSDRDKIGRLDLAFNISNYSIDRVKEATFSWCQ